MVELSRVLEVPRDEPLRRTRVTTEALLPPRDGQVHLVVERFGLSSNNVTYALLGDVLGHWLPFPAADGWGRVPAWGVATVVAGDPAVAPVGARFTGYLPMATHVSVHAVATSHGLRVVSPERAEMALMYRELRRIDGDPTWDEDLIDAEVLMLPVSPAAGLLEYDLRRAGTRHVVITSASSKTSLGVGRLLVEHGVRVTGLCGRERVPAVTSVGAFDQVLPYDDLTGLGVIEQTTYVDVAGDPAVTQDVLNRLGSAARGSVAVGGTRLASLGGTSTFEVEQPGPRAVQFDAGQREVDLMDELGHDAVAHIRQHARQVLVPWAAGALNVQRLEGLHAAGQAWVRMGAGSLEPLEAIIVYPSSDASEEQL